LTNSARTFPNEGLRAVNVPLETIEVRADSGLVRSKDSNYNGEITELDGDFEKIRSMLIFVDVDCKLEGVYDEPIPLQAGWNPIQNMRPQEQFQLDLGALTKNLEPSEAQVQLYLFNTEILPIPVDSKKVRAVKDVASFDVNEDTWQTVLLQPTFPYDKETITFSNEGSNDLEYRILTHHAGNTREVELDSSGSTVKTLTSGS